MVFIKRSVILTIYGLFANLSVAFFSSVNANEHLENTLELKASGVFSTAEEFWQRNVKNKSLTKKFERRDILPAPIYSGDTVEEIVTCLGHAGKPIYMTVNGRIYRRDLITQQTTLVKDAETVPNTSSKHYSAHDCTMYQGQTALLGFEKIALVNPAIVLDLPSVFILGEEQIAIRNIDLPNQLERLYGKHYAADANGNIYFMGHEYNQVFIYRFSIDDIPQDGRELQHYELLVGLDLSSSQQVINLSALHVFSDSEVVFRLRIGPETRAVMINHKTNRTTLLPHYYYLGDEVQFASDKKGSNLLLLSTYQEALEPVSGQTLELFTRDHLNANFKSEILYDNSVSPVPDTDIISKIQWLYP